MDKTEILNRLDFLHPNHLADLRKSGLSDETIQVAGIKSVSPREIPKKLGFDIPGLISMYEIPYPGCEGYSRFKAFYAPGENYHKDGSAKPKYLARKDSGNRLYIPPKVEQILSNPTIPLYITEGEKKALKAVQEGLPCLAISGLWNWGKKTKNGYELLPDFNQISLEGRTVYLVPDSDWLEPNREGKPKNLKQAVNELISLLVGKGAHVSLIKLPSFGIKKIGLDDYLCFCTVEDFEKLPKENDKHNSTSLMILTRLDSLFQEPEEATTWLVDGLLPSGGFSIIAAKPKVGKSTTARNLALNIARNEPFLDRSVNPGAVIYLALEEKRAEVRKHFRAMGATGDEEIHIYTGGAPVDAIKQITSVVESLKPVLLIIDPLFRLVKLKDGNDYIQVTNALDPLLRLARDTGTHVLCVHHSPKGERNPEDCLLGSQAIFGSVDTLMIMKRHENYRTLQTIQRYGEDLEETVLNYNKGEGSVTVGNTRQEQDTNCMEELIIDFLSKQNEPVTEKVVNEEVEGRTTLKRKALRELIKQNEIARVGKGGKGDPYKYTCSQYFACSQLGNESGNNKNSKENHQEKDSCSLVPSIGQEQQNNNTKIAETLGGCREDSCSQVPVFPETEKKLREHANLTKNEGENNETFEVEFLEVVG